MLVRTGLDLTACAAPALMPPLSLTPGAQYQKKE